MAYGACCMCAQVIPTVGVDGPDGEKRRLAMLKAFSSLVCETASRAKFLNRFQRRPSGSGSPHAPGAAEEEPGASAAGGAGASLERSAADDDSEAAGGDAGAAGLQPQPAVGAGGSGAVPSDAAADVAGASGTNEDGVLEIEVTVPAAGAADDDVDEWEEVDEEGQEKRCSADDGILLDKESEHAEDSGAAGVQKAQAQSRGKQHDAGEQRGPSGGREIELVEISSSNGDEEEGGGQGEGCRSKRGRERKAAEPDQAAALAEVVEGYGREDRRAQLERQASGAHAGGRHVHCCGKCMSACLPCSKYLLSCKGLADLTNAR